MSVPAVLLLLALPPGPAAPTKPADAEVQFTDGSTLKLKVLDESLDLVTPYGPLKIPVRAIRKVELGLRVTDAEVKEIEAAVADLLGPSTSKRESAKATLTRLGAKAIPAVRRASRKATEDASGHVDALLEKLIAALPDGAPPLPDHDTVVTEDSQIAGRLAATSVRVLTSQFGEQRLKFDGVRVVVGPAGEPAAEVAGVVDAPSSMVVYQNRHGTMLSLRVTGAIAGSIWGSGTYTLDSNLAMAAVHAGALRVGQTGVVRVRIIPTPPTFAGTTQNGVTSTPYGPYPAGAYEIVSGRGR